MDERPKVGNPRAGYTCELRVIHERQRLNTSMHRVRAGICLPQWISSTFRSVVTRRRSAVSVAAKRNKARARMANKIVGARLVNRGTGTETTAVCANCGQTTTVPFEPRGDRPVYCKNCYKPKQGGRGRGASGGGNRDRDRRRY
jgi:CxxC-x17-CxxC domain-containing protein